MKYLENFKSFKIDEISKYLKHAAFLKGGHEYENNPSKSEKNRRGNQAHSFMKHVNPEVKKKIEKFLNTYVNIDNSETFKINIEKRIVGSENINNKYNYQLKVNYYDNETNKMGDFSIDSEGYEYISDNLKSLFMNNSAMRKQFSNLLNFIREEELIPYLD